MHTDLVQSIYAINKIFKLKQKIGYIWNNHVRHLREAM